MEYSSLDSCRSDDTFCIYERYMRSFQRSEPAAELCEAFTSEYCVMPSAPAEEDLPPHHDEPSLEPESLQDNDSSNKGAAASSDDTTRSDTSCRLPKPALIASLVSMENSNNAVDGGRLFEPPAGDVVFKLPNNELTFNGTLKHLQKLKPIVDPMAVHNQIDYSISEIHTHFSPERVPVLNSEFTTGTECTNGVECTSCVDFPNGSETESSSEVNYASSSWSGAAGAGRESGESLASCGAPPGSPDVFSEEEEWSAPHARLQHFLSQHETYDRIMLKKLERTLSGVIPPPSVTTLNLDVNEMLKKYYGFLPLFKEGANVNHADASTPTKGMSYVTIPPDTVLPEPLQETTQEKPKEEKVETKTVSLSLNTSNRNDMVIVDDVANLNVSDLSGPVPEMGTEEDAKGMTWPEILKCRFYDVHYNVCVYSERVERAAMRVGQRYVGAEMTSSVTIFASAGQSPSSAQKRKALRVKLAQSKSPGRRLSHLARRRQAFCSAATYAEKTQSGPSKMVLIDKKKLTYTSERKSPRTKRTPGRKTPGKKTPGKKTPGRKLASSSSKKKAMRRLVMDTEKSTRSQPTRETSKRALFQSPEIAKVPPPPQTTNARAVKTKRALFSPTRDVAPCESWGKRKFELDDSVDGAPCKMQKSLSFGGEAQVQPAVASLARRATEMFSGRRGSELNPLQKQKLLWAVSNALRAHGWRMGAPGFKEKASALAQLTRRMLTLPAHAARLATATSTSDYMLRLARKYVFSVIQGCPIEECYMEEQVSLNNEASTKLTGYVSVQAYQLMKSRAPLTAPSLSQTFTASSRIKENTCDSVTIKADPPKSATKNILQDKLINIDSNSNSNSFSASENVGLFKSNSMPSFKDTAKLRARRQISFDNIDVPPKR